jgi:hypothetical protein
LKTSAREKIGSGVPRIPSKKVRIPFPIAQHNNANPTNRQVR